MINPSPRLALAARSLALGLAWVGVLTPTGIAADPAWWTARGAVDGGAPNPNAVVNQGQLKQFTLKAVQELNTDLPGGAGPALNSLVDSWQQDYAANHYATDPTNPFRPFRPADFQAVNVGQLKQIASLIYAPLVTAGYFAGPPSWLTVNPASDHALAIVGQLRSVFNFDLTADIDNNGAGNGLPDWWELKYFGHTGVDPHAPLSWNSALTNLQAYQRGLNPNDPFAGQAATLSNIAGDQQIAAAGGFAPQALTVQVLQRGNAVCNTPVTFAVQSSGQVQATASSTPASTVTVTTNASGIARTFFILPNASAGTVCEIGASAGTGTERATSAFHEAVGGSDYNVQDVASSISNLVGVFNPDGSEDLTWTNNTDDPVPIWKRDAADAWVPFTTLPAGTTSYRMQNP